MHAQVGDVVVVDSQSVGRASRHGRIEEILGSEEGTHFLVRWSDGQQTLYYPGPDGHVVGASEVVDSASASAPRRLNLSGSVSTIMAAPAPLVGAHDTLRDLAARLADTGASALMVFDGEELTGIVSERDIVLSLAAGADPDEVWVADVARVDPVDIVWASPDDSVVEAADLMNRRGIRHLPVGGGGQLAGMVSAGDVLRAVVGQ